MPMPARRSIQLNHARWARSWPATLWHHRNIRAKKPSVRERERGFEPLT